MTVKKWKTMKELVVLNSYDWRQTAYYCCGFETEDSIGFWQKNSRLSMLSLMCEDAA